MERVVEYEASRGRIAQPQPHNNKGFDVISCRPDGSDRRIIEVKATARDWPDRGVLVSDSQIDKNRELGDEFWLYVVEHAEDPEQARVTAIQNPVAPPPTSRSTPDGVRWARRFRRSLDQLHRHSHGSH